MDVVDRLFNEVDKQFETRKAFAKAISMPESRVSEWADRISSSYLKKLPIIAKTLSISLDWLFFGDEESHNRLNLHDSAVVIQPDDFRHLSLEEMDMVLAYRQATAKERRTIDGILSEYKKGTTAETG